MLLPAIRRMRQRLFPTFVLGLSISLTLGCGSGSAHTEPAQMVFPSATVPLTKLSSDPYTNSTSQHATEVEPDTFAFGSTIVTAFQVGRIHGGGAADIGFATSTEEGLIVIGNPLDDKKNKPGVATLLDGDPDNNFLQRALTFNPNGLLKGAKHMALHGSSSAASDASVAYDAAHGMWVIASLGIGSGPAKVLVSRSPDAINWGNPIMVTTAGDADKSWIVCDNTSTSQFYGHCYIEWDDVNSGDLIKMNTSTDGGLTWGSALNTADGAHGIGGQPLVQPNGKVIVPITGGVFNSVLAFSSSDGGANWSKTITISSVTDHTEAGGLRSGPLPSAEIDAAGTVYVVWADCRFRTNCTSNDLVLSTSPDGVTWAKPERIPIDPITSTVDHFIPGLGVDPATSGSSAHLTLTYYYYLVSNCGTVCQMGVAFGSSQDGGQSWSAPVELAGPMNTNWLPNTFSGLMAADYISTSYVSGNAFAVFAVAKTPSGSMLDEAMYTTTSPLAVAAEAAHFSSRNEHPVPNAKSDHGPAKFYDLDHEHPIPPKTRTPRRSARR